MIIAVSPRSPSGRSERTELDKSNEAKGTWLSRIKQGGEWVKQVLGSAVSKFYWDDGFSRAAALAYTTLFALVPLTWLAVSMFTIFGMSETELGITLRRILEQILPANENERIAELQNNIIESLQHLARNIRALNTLSIGALVFTSIALINTIESALNAVWRATSEMSIVAKIASFWTVITLGPLLVATSFLFTTTFRSYLDGGGAYSYALAYAIHFVIPVIVSWLGLTLLFYKLPSARVRLHEAAFGAVVAAVLFEIAKRAFAYYVGLSTTYNTLYGVLATIPLFLFWLYVTWVVVIFGAEVSYQAGSVRILRGRKKYATDLGEIGALLGLRILYAIGRNFVSGEAPLTEGRIAVETGADPVLVRACLNVLAENGIITASDPVTHTRTLLISPEKLRVQDIILTFLSKRQRERLLRQGFLDSPKDEEMFLQILGRAAQRSGDVSKLGEWTLASFLDTPRSA